MDSKTSFEIELQELLNRYSKENGSNTPDFILANYLDKCLTTFDVTVRLREQWWTNALKNESADPPTKWKIKQ